MPRTGRAAQVIPVNLENEDKCSVVSIVPFPINEFKPGIYPGRFNIAACKNPKIPEILIVGTSVHFIPQFNGDDELPAHVVKTTCKDIAIAVVNDYLRGQMNVNPERQPGITWVPEVITGADFAKKYPTKLQELIKYQLNWFAKLVEQADNDWNKYKRHTVVSDNQRFAARALGLEKEWLIKDATNVPIKCPACLSNCEQNAIVCATCRCILKPEEYKKLTFAA